MYQRESKEFGIHLSIILRRGQMYLNREVNHLDVRAGQIPILRVLEIKDGIDQKSIRKYLHLDKGTIAKTIRPLIDKRYVIRKTNPRDKRANQIFLTRKGREIMPEVTDVVNRWMEALTAGFTEEEKEAAYTLVSRMSENARKCLKDQASSR